MNQSEAAKQVLIRPWYHGPLGIIGVLTLLLYSYELRLLYLKRKSPPFNSMFFSLWKNQAIIDIFVLLHYLLAGFIRNFPITWDFFLSLNRSVFPPLLEVILLLPSLLIFPQCCMVFQVTSEMGGVTLISLHRFIAVCFPVSSLTKRIDNMPRMVITFFQVFLSAPLLIPFLISQPAYKVPSSVSSVSLQLSSVSSHIASSFIEFPGKISCASFPFPNSRFTRLKGRVNKQELKMTILAFALFCSLLFYFSFTFVAAIATALKMPTLLVFIQAYIFFPTFVLAITNPWCLILSGTLKKSKRNEASTANRTVTVKTVSIVRTTRFS